MLGLSQLQVADRLSVKPTALSNWENGTRAISLDIEQIDKALEGGGVLARASSDDGMGALARVNAVEYCTIMNKKVDAKSLLLRERDKRQVVAKDLHFTDTFARTTRNLNIELISSISNVDN